MRVLLTAIAYLLSLVVIAVLAFYSVLVLAGPHAGLLPGWLEAVVLVLGWLAVLVLPAVVAHRIWRYIGNRAT